MYGHFCLFTHVARGIGCWGTKSTKDSYQTKVISFFFPDQLWAFHILGSATGLMHGEMCQVEEHGRMTWVIILGNMKYGEACLSKRNVTQTYTISRRRPLFDLQGMGFVRPCVTLHCQVPPMKQGRGSHDTVSLTPKLQGEPDWRYLFGG